MTQHKIQLNKYPEKPENLYHLSNGIFNFQTHFTLIKSLIRSFPLTKFIFESKHL